MSVASKIATIEPVTTELTSGTVKKIGTFDSNRELVILSNETASDFYYAFGKRDAVIGNYTTTDDMFKLRADTDLYFTDGIPVGPLFVLQSSGSPLDIKTKL